jgi:ferredoxin
MPTRHLRILTQWAVFILWVGLIYGTHHPMDSWLVTHLPPSLLLRIDPLAMTVVCGGMRMGITILMLGFVTLIVSLLLGRVFCGWVCPLGATFDAWGWFLKKFRHRAEGPSPSWYRLKFYLLAAILIFAVLGGVSPLMGLDPIVLITRVAAVVLNPFWRKSGELAWSIGSPLPTHGYLVDTATLVLFLGIMSATTRLSRIWCRAACPLGAYLSVASRHAVLRRETTGCVHCNICARHCPTGAISLENPEVYTESECIKCFTCSQDCPVDANAFSLKSPIPVAAPSYEPVSLERRSLVATAAAAVLAGPAMNLSSGDPISHKKLMRPPMSREEHDFLSSCIRCGECMKACPTGILKPAGIEHGFRALWSPVMVPTEGWCQKGCNACSKACPTDAIMKYEIADKYKYKSGTAVFNSNRCISYTEGKFCSECVRVCPTNAIEFKKGWEPLPETSVSSAAPVAAAVTAPLTAPLTASASPSAPVSAPSSAPSADPSPGPSAAAPIAVASPESEPAPAPSLDPARVFMVGDIPIAAHGSEKVAPAGETPTRPFHVNFDRCVGCGACEYACNEIVFGDPCMITTSFGRASATTL